jgi:transcriptional regulator with XRE-family HTH domain
MGDEVPRKFSGHLAENLPALRARRRISQTALAELMTPRGFAWSHSTVAAIETPDEAKRRRVSIDELFGLALVLDVTIAELLDPHGRETELGLPTGILPVHVRAWLQSAIRITWAEDGVYEMTAADGGWLPLPALFPETLGSPPNPDPEIAEHRARIEALRN